MQPKYRDWLRTLGAPEDPVATDTSSEWSAMSLLKAIYKSIDDGTFISAVIASEAEALAGVNNTHVMTPLRTLQSITEFGLLKTENLSELTDVDAARQNLGFGATPGAGQILVGNAGGTAYAPKTMGGDATIDDEGALAIGSGKVTNDMLNADVFSTAQTWTNKKTITIANATLTQGLVVNQEPAGNVTLGGGDVTFLNAFLIDNLNIADTSSNSDAIIAGAGVKVLVDGANHWTPNATFAFVGDIQIYTQKAQDTQQYGAILARAIARQDFANNGYGIAGLNANVAIDAGVTGCAQINSAEFDVTVSTGANPTSKYGVVVLLGPTDAVQGSSNDAAIAVHNAPGTTLGWKRGIHFDASVTSTRVFSDDAIVIAISGTQTIADFIDIEDATVTGSVLKWANGVIAGDGGAELAELTIEKNQNGNSQTTLKNTTTGASAQCSLSIQGTSANAALNIFVADQTGSPDAYIDSASSINNLRMRLNSSEYLRLIKTSGILVSKPIEAAEQIVVTAGANNDTKNGLRLFFGSNIGNIYCLDNGTPTWRRLNIDASPLVINGNGGNGNLGFLTASFGSGQGVINIGNRNAAPSTNPTGGGILYAESGALKWKGSGGTVTTIANA